MTAATRPMAAGKKSENMAWARNTPLLLFIANPDARPATAPLSPHREQLLRARRRRPPASRERLSPAAVYSDWARTLPWFYSVLEASDFIRSGCRAGRGALFLSF